MQIALQSTQIELNEIEHSFNAITSLGKKCYEFGLIPFTDEVTGGPFNEPTIMLGATKLAKLFLKNKLPENGIIFYDRLKFDQYHYINKIGKCLLNSDAVFLKYADIKDTIVTTTQFVKPSSDLKFFAGKVIEPDGVSTYSELICKNRMIDEDLDSEDVYILSNETIIDDIEAEYRVYIVDNQIIDAGQYMERGNPIPLALDDLTRKVLYNYVRLIQKMYEPHKHYVIDIAELADSTFKVVEYNCINCSGMYKIDRTKVYAALLNT